MVAADLLVIDRLGEFQRLAKSKGTLQEDGESFPSPAAPAGEPPTTQTSTSAVAKLLGKGSVETIPLAAPVAASKGVFLKEFFEQVSEINGVLAKGRSNVKTMGQVLEDALQATTPERQKAVSDQLYDLVEDTNGKVHSVKAALEDMRSKTNELEKEECRKCPGKCGFQVTWHDTHCCGHCAAGKSDHGSKCEAKPVIDKVKIGEIRTNMQNQLAKKHCQLLVDFQKAQIDFKEALNQRQARELHMVMPEATEEEVKELVDSGHSLSLAVAQKMAGTHYRLIDEVNRIQDKHQDILRLEKSAADLAQMFKEMAVLVDAQGEMIDAIEVNVHKAKVYTAKAEENLITTRKAQHSAQRWMCCIAVVMLIILLSILLPVLVKQ